MKSKQSRREEQKITIDKNQHEVEESMSLESCEPAYSSISINEDDVVLVTSKISEKFNQFLNRSNLAKECEILNKAMESEE